MIHGAIQHISAVGGLYLSERGGGGGVEVEVEGWAGDQRSSRQKRCRCSVLRRQTSLALAVHSALTPAD